MSRLLLGWCMLLALSSRWQHCAEATFSFPGFSSSGSSKPFMATLGSSLQKYFALPMGRVVNSGPEPAASAHSPGYLLPAAATVGIGTILQGGSYPPPVKAIPYGPPRPVSPGMMHSRPHFYRPHPHGPQRIPSMHPKYPPMKNSYYGPPKFKPQHLNNLPLDDKSPNEQHERYYQLDNHSVKEHGYNSQHSLHTSYPQSINNKNNNNNRVNGDYLVGSTQNIPVSQHAYPEDYTRSEVLHSSYTASTNDETSNRAPVIVYQGVRPPVRFYQEPHPNSATSDSAMSKHHSNLNHGIGLSSNSVATSNYERADSSSNQFQLDYSRPDPVFSATINSDWKPINAPAGAVPARGYSITPPDLSRRADASKQVHMTQPEVTAAPIAKEHHTLYTGVIDRADNAHHNSQHEQARGQEEEPSEEVVSAVVFVKQ